MATVEAYLAALRAKAAAADVIGRFYLSIFDEDLAALAETLNAEGRNEELHAALVAEHRAWLAALTAEQRRRLAEHNDVQTGANRNWLLHDLLGEEAAEARA